MRVSAPIVLCAFALSLAACTCGGGPPAGTPCTFDSECSGTDICGPAKICVPKPTCPDTACGEGQACVSGSCYARACANRTCGEGQVCAGGTCTDEQCVGKSCSGGGTCVRGGCYTRSCEIDTCTQAEVCVAQECIPKKCLGVTCAGDQRCAADGKCYDRGGAGGGPGTGPGPSMVPQATGGGSAGSGAGAGSSGAGTGGSGAGTGGSGAGTGGSGAGTGGSGAGTGGGSGAGTGGSGAGTGGSGAGTGGSGAGTGGSGAGTGGSGAGSGTLACQGRCGPTQVCVNNACIEARCIGVVCPMGLACAQGACVPASCGPNGGPCPAGQACGSTGACVETACATVTCPGGYRCSAGLCLPASADGGVPTYPDGGPAVIIGPDGGIIGVPGADGGLSRLPDGGAVGGPCLPWQCTEINCGNGLDDNLNGLTDCEDPSCGAQPCNDRNTCTYNETCQAGQCRAGTTLTCNTPPSGPCWQPTGSCQWNQTCLYSVNFAGTCPNAGDVCRPGGMCGPAPGMAFGWSPANVDPATLPRPPNGILELNGAASFNSTTLAFGGAWPTPRPLTAEVMTPTGPAVVLVFDSFYMNSTSSLRLTGNRPVILLAHTAIILSNAVIDASGRGTIPGAAGNLNCGTSAGGNGGTNNNTAAGAGGAGSFHSPGAPGGGGSTFTTGGTAGVSRTRMRFALVGGCPGGNGGGTQGGVGGAGGGAVQLVARFGILMDDSKILVNGAGGAGAGGSVTMTQGPGGGGGGGSGGTIVIQSPYVVATRSYVLSNGGGGGEGAGIIDLGFLFGGGRDGADGNVIPGFTSAPGGAGGSFNGGNGGSGGAMYGNPSAGLPGTSYLDSENSGLYEAGGGGGGGAAGAVLVDLITGTSGFTACEIQRVDTIFSPVRDLPQLCQ
ncbi:MAG: hypothetical protein JNJ54_11660 [Myxococcaceae bacterium]|nr:hypothetical protein [Myxococcaceae bacterium]